MINVLIHLKTLYVMMACIVTELKLVVQVVVPVLVTHAQLEQLVMKLLISVMQVRPLAPSVSSHPKTEQSRCRELRLSIGVILQALTLTP